MAIVQVKPIINKNESRMGLEKHGLTRAPGAAFYVEALVDPHTGGRRTGMTEIEAAELGKKLNLDLNPFSPYWDGFRIKLEDGALTIDTEVPTELLQLYVLKANKYVAPSQAALRSGSMPEALFLIYDPNEEVKVEKNQIEKNIRASAEIQKMLPTKRKWIATALFNKSYENVDVDAPFVDLGRFVEGGKKNVETFLGIINKPDERLEGEYILKLGVIYNVLRKSGDMYMRGDRNEIGHNLEAAVDYIISPSRQDSRLQIENEIASKVGITFRSAQEINTKEEREVEAKKTKKGE